MVVDDSSPPLQRRLRGAARRLRGRARAEGAVPVIGGPLAKARMGVEVARAATLGRRTPVFVGWQLTDRCNLSCDYCGRWDLYRDELSDQRMLELVDELAEAGVRRVAFTGGEPLSHRLCLALGRKCRRRGMQVSLNTNGVLVPRYLDQLTQAVDTLTISIDGDREQHEASRGQGSYDGAIAGAEAAVAAGLPVNLHCVVTRHNHAGQDAAAVDHVLDLAARLGGAAGFAPVQEVPGMRRRDTASLAPGVEQWRATVDHLLARKAAGETRVQNSVAGLRYLRHWPVYAPIRCSAGLIYARIEPDGQVYGCGNLVLGTGPSVVDLPFGQAFAQLPQQDCRDCWCDTRVEMNLVLSGDLSALFSAFYR